MKRGRSIIFPHTSDQNIGGQVSGSTVNALDEAMTEAWRTSDNQRNRQYLGDVVAKWRWRSGLIAVFFGFGLLVIRAGQIQIVQGGEYHALAEGNRVGVHYLPARRGIIYDRNRNVLAENFPNFRLVASLINLPESEEEKIALLSRLREVIDLSVAEALSRLADSAERPQDPVALIEDVPYEEALAFLLNQDEWPGIFLETANRRHYPLTEKNSLAHLLGYVGVISEEEYERRQKDGYRAIDKIGKSGLELFYEPLLRGKFGRQIVETDAYGREVSVIAKEDAVDGANLFLSLDLSLTQAIEKILGELAGEKARAVVIVANPNNGQILAMISLPSYDANLFSQTINDAAYQKLLDDPGQPLFFRAIAGEYPSGSTFKPIVASAALTEGIIDAKSSFLSNGGLAIGPWFFSDWKAGGHGTTDVVKAIAESVNTFFYIVGGGFDTFVGLGIERITDYARRFGLGTATGVDLPFEADGFLPSPEWKEEVKGEKWYIGDTYHVAIGQGDLLITPIQLTMAMAALANGGRLFAPRLVQAVESADGNFDFFSPVVLNEEVVPIEVIKVVKRGLRQAVLTGSARSLQTLPVTVAGKTGTAQWSSTKQPHAWFTGFAPYDDPQIVVTVLVEEAGGGDRVAVPIAKEIINWWFTQFDVSKLSR